MARLLPSKFTTIEAIRDFLAGTTNYEKIQHFRMQRSNFDLERLQCFLDRLGSPQNTFEAVHIAGTTGKGSTCMIIEALLRSQGLKTGLYTSPHLEHERERIAVQGQTISEKDFIKAFKIMEKVLAATQKTGDALTYFEILTAAAFLTFREAQVNIAVLETGLGGRLDATNIIMPRLSVITSIGHDHRDKLGESLRDIAYEKAGIIKTSIPILVGHCAPEPFEVIRRKAQEENAPLRSLNHDFGIKNIQPNEEGIAFSFWSKGGWSQSNTQHKRLIIKNLNAIQASNTALALEALGILYRNHYLSPLDKDALHKALANVAFPGRCEWLQDKRQNSPSILLDVAHNPESIQETLKLLQQRFAGIHKTLLFGIAQDKELETIMEALPTTVQDTIFTEFPSARATPVDKLDMLWRKFGGPPAELMKDPVKAFEWGYQLAQKHAGMLIICGSFYLVGLLRPLAKAQVQEQKEIEEK